MRQLSGARRRLGSLSRSGTAGVCAALAAASVLVAGAGSAGAQPTVSPNLIGLQEVPITGLAGPTGVAVNNGDLYVADKDGDQVIRYSRQGVQTTLLTGVDAYDVEVSGGRVYVSDTTGDAVWRMDSRGNWTKLFDINGPLGLVVSGNTLYVVAGSANGGILDGGNAVYSFALNKRNAAPVDITWTPAGATSLRDVEVIGSNLYVTDDVDNKIYGRDKKGNVSEILPGDRGADVSVNGMDYHRNQLFVADSWLDTVYVLDKNFRSTMLAVNDTIDAWDVAAGWGSRAKFSEVYIADRANNRVVMYERR